MATISQNVSITQSNTFDWSITDERIRQVVNRIVELCNPIQIIAFGSRARGEHGPDSDLDLAVIVDEYDPTVDARPVWRADLDIRMAVDLLVVGWDRHEFMKHSIVSVHYDIAKEGVVLYDRSAGSIDQGAIERIA